MRTRIYDATRRVPTPTSCRVAVAALPGMRRGATCIAGASMNFGAPSIILCRRSRGRHEYHHHPCGWEPSSHEEASRSRGGPPEAGRHAQVSRARTSVAYLLSGGGG
ncbi:hypothetical protein C8Q73DRAFT_709550 [Cubamyces lactineus]|nr:hypothetical protein C8Q73DRAFT_709550 [Cubamyces lactineus]